MPSSKIEIHHLIDMKRRGEKISMLTAYDYPSARILDEAGIDCLLVGDSAANVVLGYPDTLPVSMDELVILTRAVSRGAKRSFVIGDMPFMSYNISVSDAIRNAGRFLKEGRANAIKLEGGGAVADTVRALVQAGIPVVGHLGLTPQTAGMIGGLKVQGRTAEQAAKILEDAKRLEEAGAFMLVLEAIPKRVAALISSRVSIPVIGIGAGCDCDGQVLVLHDMLGINAGFKPKFVKRFAQLEQEILDAARRYHEEVRAQTFPAEEHSFTIDDEQYRHIESVLGTSSKAKSNGGNGRSKHRSTSRVPVAN